MFFTFHLQCNLSLIIAFSLTCCLLSHQFQSNEDYKIIRCNFLQLKSFVLSALTKDIDNIFLLPHFL
jgi:hypothetical protein